MRRKVIMYLEEYARRLSEDVKFLLEQAERDGDADAAEEAKQLEERISDIRRIVSYISIRASFKD